MLLFALCALASAGDPAREALTFRLKRSSDAKRLGDARIIIERRLAGAGLERLKVEAQEAKLVIEKPSIPESRVVRDLVLRPGYIEFRNTIEPSAAGYASHWRQFKEARGESGLKKGEVLDAEGKLRWYRLRDGATPPYPKQRLPESQYPYVLCRVDGPAVTSQSMENVEFRQSTVNDTWRVMYDIRVAYRDQMARIAKADAFLALIVDREVQYSWPVSDPTHASGQLGGFSEHDARVLAGLLCAGPLPVPFVAAK